MEAGLDPILRQLRLQTGGGAGAGGGAASAGGRLKSFSCSLGRLPTGAAAAVSGPTVSGAGGGEGGSAYGGACGGAGGGADRGAGVGAASGGGRLQPFSCSLRWLPTGAAAADGSGASGGLQPLRLNMRWRHPPVYRPLVDLVTMEDRDIILTYRLDRDTIQELSAQLEPDLMSAIRHPTDIPL
ncbi:hypothetical protein NDU88_001243 [Pleurodeles waltl]|uniref:Uncharacterized protein n=1 Tax=Pleurodeles waltl TaxID=8319 RepID=A0AAV7TJK3_PLEWA|nr:hypothetical protein NDU88_001243 [Pleurodeles waltl]